MRSLPQTKIPSLIRQAFRADRKGWQSRRQYYPRFLGGGRRFGMPEVPIEMRKISPKRRIEMQLTHSALGKYLAEVSGGR